MIKKVIYKNKHNILIDAFHYIPEKESQKGIILCHGMQSNKNGTKVSYFADFFCKHNFHTLRFDFRYVSASSEVKFENITISGEVEDLEASFDHFKRNNINEIIIIGSSLGGTVSSVFASKNKISKLITICSPFLFEKQLRKWFTKQELKKYEKEKFINHPSIKIKWSFAEDALNIDFEKVISKIECPVLIIHGSRDEVVNIENAHYFYSKLKSKKEIYTIEDGDHSLNNYLELLVEKIKNFII